MSKSEVGIYYPTTKRQWRKWLLQNHLSKDAVWLIFYKKDSGMPSLKTGDAIDEALCFGWIDGKAMTIDHESYRQYFCKRKAVSTWSKINKKKVEYLIGKGLMNGAGFKSVEAAKQNGSWGLLDEVEELIIPEDLEAQLDLHTASKAYFLSLSRSVRKSILQWLVLARRPETRQRRIIDIAELAAKKQKPKQFLL